jgi:hypothetical protein
MSLVYPAPAAVSAEGAVLVTPVVLSSGPMQTVIVCDQVAAPPAYVDMGPVSTAYSAAAPSSPAATTPLYTPAVLAAASASMSGASGLGPPILATSAPVAVTASAPVAITASAPVAIAASALTAPEGASPLRLTAPEGASPLRLAVVAAAAPARPAGATAGADADARFAQLVKRRELNPRVAAQLREVLSTCDISLLCDDSDSMAQAIAEEGTDHFAAKLSSRWLELKRLAAVLIEIVTAMNPAGIDIHFLNRPSAFGVTTTAGLASVFATPPAGATPLVSRLCQLTGEAKGAARNASRLLIVITDGEPTDGSRDDLRQALEDKPANVHLSFAECTDQADDCEYLDAYTGLIRNFDNTDDYREEQARVKAMQGTQFKFDFGDYVIKILLATFVRWYFNLDRAAVAAPALTAASAPALSPPSGPWSASGSASNAASSAPPQSFQQFQPGTAAQFQPAPALSASPQAAPGCCAVM